MKMIFNQTFKKNINNIKILLSNQDTKILQYSLPGVYKIQHYNFVKKVKYTREIDENKLSDFEERLNKIIKTYKKQELEKEEEELQIPKKYFIDENGSKIPNKQKNSPNIKKILKNGEKESTQIVTEEEFDKLLDDNSKNNQIVISDDLKKNFSHHYPVFYRDILCSIQDNNHFRETRTKVFDRTMPFLVGDLTFGLGNLSLSILENFSNSHILGVDIDPKMIDFYEKNNLFSEYKKQDRVKLFKDNYCNINGVVEDCFKLKSFLKKPYNNNFKNKKLDYAVLDLGFNSMQLKEEFNRGISYQNLEDDLDMRFDQKNNENATASEILNNSSQLELIDIFQTFGEEKFSELLVSKIIKQRKESPYSKVKDLVKTIDDAFTRTANYKNKYNIYARIFQALRISVNYETLNIQRVLYLLPLVMNTDSLLFAISFHSIEDRLVRSTLKDLSNMGYGVLYDKMILPSDKELEENARSKSAIMRVFKFNGNLN